MSIDFLILYEHKAREIENIVLLSIELERAGFKVEIDFVGGANKFKYFLYKKPRYILVPWLRDEEDFEFFKKKYSKPKAFVNMRWEQVFPNSSNIISINMPKGEAKLIHHFAWGKEALEHYNKSGLSNEKRIMCGPIHLDFTRKQFLDYYMNKMQISQIYSINYDSSWILFISSFAFAGSSEAHVSYVESRFGINQSNFASISDRSQLMTLDWINRVLNENRNIVFIYRPHPDEINMSRLEKIMAEHKNFYVISEQSVKQWILVCQKSYTWLSTSVIEAYFLNKQCYVLRPYKIPIDYDYDFFDSRRFVQTFKDFKVSLFSDGSIKFKTPIFKDMVDHKYHFGFEPAYIVASKYLIELIRNGYSDDKNLYFKNYKLLKVISIKLVSVIKSLMCNLFYGWFKISNFRLSKIIRIKELAIKNCEDGIAFKYPISKVEIIKIKKKIVSILSEQK